MLPGADQPCAAVVGGIARPARTPDGVLHGDHGCARIRPPTTDAVAGHLHDRHSLAASRTRLGPRVAPRRHVAIVEQGRRRFRKARGAYNAGSITLHGAPRQTLLDAITGPLARRVPARYMERRQRPSPHVRMRSLLAPGIGVGLAMLAVELAPLPRPRPSLAAGAARSRPRSSTRAAGRSPPTPRACPWRKDQ